MPYSSVQTDQDVLVAQKDAAPTTAPTFVASRPRVSKKLLVIWRVWVILLFLAAGSLLYLLTSSSPSWRANWSVVTIGIPEDEFRHLYHTGQFSRSLQSGPRNEVMDSTVEVGPLNLTHSPHRPITSDRGFTRDTTTAIDSRAGQGGTVGLLSVNMWGWCLKGRDVEKVICSPERMWFDLNSLFTSSTNPNAVSSASFNPNLLHALILHGIAMLVAMLALIPIGLETWRICRAREPDIQEGWFEHGSVITTCLLCMLSWIIDRSLRASVANRLPSYQVKSGLAVVITGVSTILLGVTFFFSAIPVLYVHMRRQSQLLSYWKNLEDYDAAVARQKEENEAQKPGGEGRVKRSRSMRRLRENRLTRMIFGSSENRQQVEYGGQSRGKYGGKSRRGGREKMHRRLRGRDDYERGGGSSRGDYRRRRRRRRRLP
ncbi:hypothetical protein IAR55_005910 [Kwoniella newhampshirensis]|uniref:CRIB domain-containing protein n=1 Tax=Kwoniella newhampshirensis TaxID=1651941 RepID=A0AAW0YL89_9TREE